MNYRRSVAAVAVLAAVALAACGEADDADPTPTTGRAPVSIVQAERAANAEAKAKADAAAAWEYYYQVTHPAPKAAVPQSANQIEHWSDFEARLAEAARVAAERGPVSANQAEHRATVDVTVEHEELRRGENTKR